MFKNFIHKHKKQQQPEIYKYKSISGQYSFTINDISDQCRIRDNVANLENAEVKTNTVRIPESYTIKVYSAEGGPGYNSEITACILAPENMLFAAKINGSITAVNAATLYSHFLKKAIDEIIVYGPDPSAYTNHAFPCEISFIEKNIYTEEKLISVPVEKDFMLEEGEGELSFFMKMP